MRYFLFALIICFSTSVFAQEATSAGDAERRLELAKELHVIKPIKPRIDDSINRIASQLNQVTKERLLQRLKELSIIRPLRQLQSMPWRRFILCLN